MKYNLTDCPFRICSFFKAARYDGSAKSTHTMNIDVEASNTCCDVWAKSTIQSIEQDYSCVYLYDSKTVRERHFVLSIYDSNFKLLSFHDRKLYRSGKYFTF